MATAGSSAQSVDRKGKKPVIEQESHIPFPSKLCGRPRHHITTNTTRTKPASQRTDFHGASTIAGTSAWSILGDECIDSGVSDLDFEPTRNHPGSYCKKLTAKTEDGEVVLRVAGHMRLADGYKLVGQELGLLNPPGAVAGDFEARPLREENKVLKENVAQLVQEIEDMRRKKEALQRTFRKEKDESGRLKTRNQKVTEQRDEAEKNSTELAHQKFELEKTNRDLTESLEKAKADATSLTEQHHQEVQGLEERIDELRVQVQQVQTDKTALESKCRQYEHDKTSLQNKVESLEEQIGLMQGVLNVILDQTSLDHELRDEEIGSLRSDSDRWRAQIEELEEGNYILHMAYAKSETELDQLRMLSERPQRSSLPMHQRNEVRRSQTRPNWANLAAVRNERGEVGFMARREGRGGKDSETATFAKVTKRREDLKNLCFCIDFGLIQLLDDTVTKLIVARQHDATTAQGQRLRLKTAPDMESEYAPVADHLWLYIQEDPFRVRFPVYNGDGGSTPTKDISEIRKKQELSAGVHEVRVDNDEKSYVYKEVDRPLYEPRDSEVLEQELRNLELLRATNGVVWLVVAVISKNPYRTAETIKDDTPVVLRGILLEYYLYGILRDVLHLKPNTDWPWQR
ncbi:hypothetical protein BKA65DRAFT_542001 [Rhexocercosporidium sp. MPI-PUGE-AT-0058]|nr:hypothetical protein BKA65DRAFT_542001 [Rhexocercosporidium sp. MPI-PUGE-AT-0058]